MGRQPQGLTENSASFRKFIFRLYAKLDDTICGNREQSLHLPYAFSNVKQVVYIIFFPYISPNISGAVTIDGPSKYLCWICAIIYPKNDRRNCREKKFVRKLRVRGLNIRGSRFEIYTIRII